MRPAIIYIAVVAGLLVGAVGFVLYAVFNARPPAPKPLLHAPIRAEPESVDLGVLSQCGEPITVRTELVNTSDRPAHLLQVIVSCGCTVPDLKTPMAFAPGERIPLTIALDPWAYTGEKTQQVDLACAESGRPGSFRISFEVQSPIRTSPGGAHRDSEPTGLVKVTADDGTPFEIRSFEPAVVESWPLNEAPETHISIDWALVDRAAESGDPAFERDEDGRWKRGILTMHSSRADCPTIRIRLYNNPWSPAGGGGAAPAGGLVPAGAPGAETVPAPGVRTPAGPAAP